MLLDCLCFLLSSLSLIFFCILFFFAFYSYFCIFKKKHSFFLFKSLFLNISSLFVCLFFKASFFVALFFFCSLFFSFVLLDTFKKCFFLFICWIQKQSSMVRTKKNLHLNKKLFAKRDYKDSLKKQLKVFFFVNK